MPVLSAYANMRRSVVLVPEKDETFGNQRTERFSVQQKGTGRPLGSYTVTRTNVTLAGALKEILVPNTTLVERVFFGDLGDSAYRNFSAVGNVYSDAWRIVRELYRAGDRTFPLNVMRRT
jgi:hypothetical protein